MNKHLNSVPAVAVVFIDLEWDAAEWNERKMECSARVQAVRGKSMLFNPNLYGPPFGFYGFRGG